MRYEDLVLWAWLEMSFTPKRYQFSNNTLSPVIFFSVQFNTLEGIAKAPMVDLFEVKHPKRYENQFLTPKWYDEHTSPFCMGPRTPFPREDSWGFISNGSNVRRKAIPRVCSPVAETTFQKNRYGAWAELICFQYS